MRRGSLCAPTEILVLGNRVLREDSWNELLPPWAGFSVWGLQKEITNTLNH